jgi:hypothetical protein
MIKELTGLGGKFAPTARYLAQALGTGHAPWLSAPWNVLARGGRTLPAGLCLSHCVIDRCRGGAVIARPGMLPSPYPPNNLPGYLDGTNPVAGTAVC